MWREATLGVFFGEMAVRYFGLIDIHNHTIPFLDDGAKDMEVAIRMLKIAEEEGIEEIILTPHYHGGHVENDTERMLHFYNQLVENARKTDIKIKLYLGNEIYYFASVVEWIQDNKILTLAGSEYILLEFGYEVSHRELKDAVNLVCRQGYIPIIAHVERYESVLVKKEILIELIEMGAYIQLNAEAIIGDAGYKAKRLARWALKNEAIHFVGTDAHSLGHRRPKLQKAAEYIAKHYSEEYMRKIMTVNPGCVINNVEIPT